MQQNGLLMELLKAGHTVTGVVPQHSEIKNPRYTEIVFKDGWAEIFQLFTKMMMEEKGTNPLNFLSMWPKMWGKMVEVINCPFP